MLPRILKRPVKKNPPEQLQKYVVVVEEKDATLTTGVKRKTIHLVNDKSEATKQAATENQTTPSPGSKPKRLFKIVSKKIAPNSQDGKQQNVTPVPTKKQKLDLSRLETPDTNDGKTTVVKTIDVDVDNEQNAFQDSLKFIKIEPSEDIINILNDRQKPSNVNEQEKENIAEPTPREGSDENVGVNTVDKNLVPMKVYVSLQENGAPVFFCASSEQAAVTNSTTVTSTQPPPLVMVQPSKPVETAKPPVANSSETKATKVERVPAKTNVRILSKVDSKSVPAGVSVKVIPTSALKSSIPPALIATSSVPETESKPATVNTVPKPKQKLPFVPASQEKQKNLLQKEGNASVSVSDKVISSELPSSKVVNRAPMAIEPLMDPIEMFADIIEDKINRVASEQRLHAENLIQQVLYNGQLRLLSDNTRIGNGNLSMAGNIVMLKKGDN